MSEQPHESGCIFCRIVRGEIPCHRLYEDEQVLSFLDLGPLSEGHLLIIPKGHWRTIDQMPPSAAAACAAVIPAISRALTKATSATAWNVLQNNGKDAGQAVDHVHFHLIPRRADDGLGFRWPAGQLADDTAKRLVDAIRTALEGGQTHA